MAETLTPPETPPARSPLRRPGCVIALILWFGLLMLPCPMFVLATQGEISLSLGSAPGQQARLWLVMEADARGLGLSLPRVTGSDTALCVQTDVRYFFWAGSAEPVSYCECYTRAAPSGAWSAAGTTPGVCPADALERLAAQHE